MFMLIIDSCVVSEEVDYDVANLKELYEKLLYIMLYV